MKMIHAMAVATALIIGTGASFAQTPNNALKDNRPDGASNTASPDTSANKSSTEGMKGTTGSGMSTTGTAAGTPTGASSMQPGPNVLKPDQNNEKSRSAN